MRNTDDRRIAAATERRGGQPGLQELEWAVSKWQRRLQSAPDCSAAL
jgi:hypothetical protein